MQTPGQSIHINDNNRLQLPADDSFLAQSPKRAAHCVAVCPDDFGQAVNGVRNHNLAPVAPAFAGCEQASEYNSAPKRCAPVWKLRLAISSVCELAI